MRDNSHYMSRVICDKFNLKNVDKNSNSCKFTPTRHHKGVMNSTFPDHHGIHPIFVQ